MGQVNSVQEQFWEACSYGREWLVKDMIEKGEVDVNWISNISDCAPIHVASQGNVNIVRHLINAKCIIDLVDIYGNTALHHAAIAGNADVCKLLLESGADVNSTNQQGWTPLFNACYWIKPLVVKILIDHSADFTLKNKDGRRAIHEMCRCKCNNEEQEIELVEILETLVEAGCPLDEKAVSDNEERANLDLEANFTPLQFACYHCHLATVQRMLEINDSNIDDTDVNGWTALHWAAQRGNDEIVITLLLHGANMYARSKRNETPLDVTNDLKIRQILSDPACFPYPHIETNGSVTTDDEEENTTHDQ